MKNKKGYTLIELLISIAVLAFFFFLAPNLLHKVGGIGLPIGIHDTYSKGVCEGYLTNLYEKGLFHGTQDGELQLGTGQQAAIQEPWEFSVLDDSVKAKLQGALGKKVRVKYHEWFIRSMFRMNHCFEITDIEII
jgi:prepilin-type N-terminal cleavage/methylation domain-containing protein